MKVDLRLALSGSVLALVALAGCAGGRQETAVELWRAETSRATAPDAAMISTGVNEDATLEDYIAIAVRNNFGLLSARQEWKAALERAPQAGALPDPVLSYGYFLEEVETRVGPQKQRLGLSQSFPWFGTLGLRKDAALAGAEATRQRYEQVLQNLARQVSNAYAEYYYLGSSVEVTRDNLELLRFWERILSARYTAGRADYSDLVRVQVELGRLEDRLITLEDQRLPKVARLNALMNLPQETVLPWPRSLPEEPPLPSPEAIEDAVAQNNPELLTLRSMVERAERGVDLSRKAGYPDFTIGLDWVQTDTRAVDDLLDNGKDPLMARLALKLPIWRGRIRAGEREAAARRAAVSARLDDRANGIASELSDLLFRYDDAERKVSLYRDSLIPKGNQSLEAAYSAFETGRGDFLNVLDAQRRLLEFELSMERARADRLRARAGIDALIGRIPGQR